MIKLILNKKDDVKLFNRIVDHIVEAETVTTFHKQPILNDLISKSIDGCSYMTLSEDSMQFSLNIYNTNILGDNGLYLEDMYDTQLKLNKIIQYYRNNRNSHLAKRLLESYNIFIDKIDIDTLIDVCEDLNNIYMLTRGNSTLNEDDINILLDKIEPKENYKGQPNGKLIAIEGCDCSGKDYIINRLTNGILSPATSYQVTREPGGTTIAENIRDVLLNKDNYKMCVMTEALLYCASRAQHIAEVIEPQLQAGHNVITNRYYYSTLIYQHIRGVNIDKLVTLTKLTVDWFVPDVVISLYDKDFSTIRQRIENKNNKDRLEVLDIELFERVNAAYYILDELHYVQDVDKGKSDIHKIEINDPNKIFKIRDIIESKL